MRSIKVLIVCLMSLTLLACEKEESSEPIAFSLSVSDIQASSANITVKHNATNRDEYYGFAVEGFDVDIHKAIQDFLAVNKQQLGNYRHSQRKQVFKIYKLLPGRDYTYIVFGMNANNSFYGEPASVQFHTAKSEFTATVNPKWEIEYKGHSVYKDKDYSKVTVYVDGIAEERYLLVTYADSLLKGFSTIEEIISYAINEYDEKKNGNSNDDFWIEDEWVSTKSMNFYEQHYPGEYTSFAIGIDANGTPTGHYVTTGAYRVDKYPATDGYANLLTKWILTDKDGRSNNITITEKKVNESVYIIGLGGVYTDIPIVATFNRNTSALTISKQSLGDEAEVFLSGTDQVGELMYCAVYYNENNKLQSNRNVTKLTQAEPDDEGNYTFNSNFTIKLDNDTKQHNTGMVFRFERLGKATLFKWMMFPCTMIKE